MVLVLGLFFHCFFRRRLIFVSVLMGLVVLVPVSRVRMGVNMFVLVRVNQIAVTMLMSMLVSVLVHVGDRCFFVFHYSLLPSMRRK